jgi:Cohesin domain
MRCSAVNSRSAAGVRRTLRTALLLGALVGAVACGDALGAGAGQVSFVIAPEFGALAAFANNADSLHLVISRTSDASVVVDTTIGIDPVTGEATADIHVVLLSGAESFTLLLEALRSSDGMVLFSGTQTVTVTGSSGTTPVSIPVTYTGPNGAFVVIQPRDTAIAPGAAFTFTAVVFDAAEAAVPVPVTFDLADAANAVILTVSKYTGIATAGTTTGTVQVVARSADGLTDTARVAVGAVPAGVRVTPGYAILGLGGTVTETANLIDANGTVITPATATWLSRTPSVATVDATTGVVTGAAAGTAVVVGTSGTFTDSLLVRVAAAGTVPVSAIADQRAFRRPRVGDTVVVDVTANMAFVSGEVLGSYNAQFTWAPAALKYVDVQPGNFGAPTLNTSETQQGQLRFSAANATGVGGSAVVARIRFVAQAAGAGTLQLAITELSAAQTFTNLLSSVVVTNGVVTVRP